MHRVDAPGATPESEFTDGNPQTGIPATTLEAKYMNTVQRELVNVVESAGLTLDVKNDGQLKEAINEMIGPPIVLPPKPAMEIIRFGPGVPQSIVTNAVSRTICTLDMGSVKDGDIIDVQCRPDIRNVVGSGYMIVSMHTLGSAQTQSFDTQRTNGLTVWSLYSSSVIGRRPIQVNPTTKLMIKRGGSLVLNLQASVTNRVRMSLTASRIHAMLTRYTGVDLNIK